jgi:hypothetical protein
MVLWRILGRECQIERAQRTRPAVERAFANARLARTWLTSERHAPANRHPLFAAYSCYCHCRLLCPRPGTILIVATQWLFVLYYIFPGRRILSPKASMHAAKFRPTRIQRIRLCAQPQRRLIQTAQCFTDAPRPSQAEVDRARAYCANLLKYCARTSARKCVTLTRRQNIRHTLPRPPVLHPSLVTRCIPRYPRIQRRCRPRC